MKEKIKQLSEGIFEYHRPDILISEEKIELSVEEGKLYRSSFDVRNSEGRNMKGLVYSNHNCIRILTKSFQGEKSAIDFEVDCSNIYENQIIHGKITIVSNLGEKVIPFEITVESSYCMTSLGKIRDLFHFSDLAKEDWSEARKLFKSPDFCSVFLQQDRKGELQYQCLTKSMSSSQAMEEFLVAVKKKLPIVLSVEKNSYHYTKVTDKFMDKIILFKDSWGYCEIKAKTDAAFLSLEHKIIWADNFIGNRYELEYVIHPEAMAKGLNCGKILLSTVHQTIEVEVICENYVSKEQEEALETRKKEFKINLLKNYMLFRTNKITSKEYIERASLLVETLTESEMRILYELVKVHLAIIEGKEEEAKDKLTQLEERVDAIKTESMLNYCCLLYLRALFCKEDAIIRSTVKEIREIYEKEEQDWKILWFLLYLDTKYDKNPHIKIRDIKRQFDMGCLSPALYYEAMLVYNQEPAFLKDLEPFRLQTIYFGIKQDILSKEAAQQFVYLSSHQKHFHRLIYHGLFLLYKKYQSKDILSALCSVLIRGQKTEEEYFPWYRLGVESNLKITQLHEYYMYSLNEDWNLNLPQSIIYYFMYNNTLSEDKRAYLYSYIIKNKDASQSIYASYQKKIEEFGFMQLEEGKINRNLAVIYEEILKDCQWTKELTKNLLQVVFCHEIKCLNTKIKHACVFHKELKEENVVPLIDGKAKVNIYTSDAELFFLDERGNRYIATIDYTLNSYMQIHNYVNPCFDFHPMDEFILLHLYGKSEQYHIINKETIDVRKHLLETKWINESTKDRILNQLIQYYYNNFEGDLLDTYLEKVTAASIKSKEDRRLIEYLIIRGFMEKAIELMREYGYDGISVKHLIRVALNLLTNKEEYEEETFLLELCYYVLLAGKYNEAILNYLVQLFHGTTREMYEVWRLANGFEVAAMPLEERLLGQILFTEDMLAESMEIFIHYYKFGTNKSLIRGFLSYSAYQYVVNDRVVQKEIFEVMKRESYYEYSEVCMIALLKHYAYVPKLTEEEEKLIDYHLYRFIEKNMVFPFFALYKDRIKLPERIADKYYVEYKTNPKSKVYLYYAFTDGQTESIKNGTEMIIYKKEQMRNIYEGIFVKEFLLFYQESFVYYIEEIPPVSSPETKSVKTEAMSIKMEHLTKEEEESRYHRLNYMKELLERGERALLKNKMKDYICSEYIVDKVFKPR